MKTLRYFIIVTVLILSASVTNAQEIFEAVKNNNLAKVKELIEADQRLVNIKDETGRIPLHWACLNGFIDTAEYLIKNGKDINIKDNSEQTSLHMAALNGHVEIAGLLLGNGANIDIQDPSGKTPLHLAVRFNKASMAELLVEKGAPLEIREKFGRTLLLLVARETGNVKTAEYLIKKGADVKAVDNAGSDALSFAVWRGYGQLADLLISNGSEIPVKDSQGAGFLSLAASKGLDSIFMKAIRAGAVPRLDGEILHMATQGGSKVIVEYLISKKMNVNKQDKNGWSPLHNAALLGRFEIVKSLINAGADPNLRTIMGETPFNFAVNNGYNELAGFLAKKGSDTIEPKFPELKGPYMGQNPPEKQPVAFAPGIVSGPYGLQNPVVFSPDGFEATWAFSIPTPASGYGKSYSYTSKLVNGLWSYPKHIPFGNIFIHTPVYSHDGQRIYYESNGDYWVLEKNATGWNEPRRIAEEVNVYPHSWWFSIDKNENLYFGSNWNGQNGIFYSKFVNGKHTQPVFLGDEIGSGGMPFISPDGSYLVFNRDGDFYVSFKLKSGAWCSGIRLNDSINISGLKVCPYITPDGKYFSYMIDHDAINWVSTTVIEELRPKE
jgi:ankyrin repeat protein